MMKKDYELMARAFYRANQQAGAVRTKEGTIRVPTGEDSSFANGIARVMEELMDNLIGANVKFSRTIFMQACYPQE